MSRYSFNFVKKFKFALLGVLLAVGAAGAVALLQPASSEQTASARPSCDSVNIAYCGLGGNSTAAQINDLQKLYKQNSCGVGGHFCNKRAAYNWAGASLSMINGMNTSNTKVGTLYRSSGNIYVGGKKVGTNSWMAARFGAREGYKKIAPGIWVRSVTPRHNQYSTYKVLVHFNKYGEADFAVAIDCGNAVKFHTVPTKPELVCKNLNVGVGNPDNRTYSFKAYASVKNNEITKYVFHFGDGHSKTVNTHATTASTSHTFASWGHKYSGYVTVYSTRKGSTTSSRCHFSLTTPRPAASLVCKDLDVKHLSGTSYSFTASADASNTTITSYVFHFGDGSSKTVKTSKQSTTVSHSFASQGKSYSGYVTVDSNRTGAKTSSKCHFSLKTPVPQPELVCESLTVELGKGKLDYNFTANAAARNTTITSYVFDFGDGNSQTVNTSSTTAQASHTYSQYDHQYTASVTVNSTRKNGVTSSNCQVTVTTPKQPVSPELVCSSLTFDNQGDNTYQFTANAAARNTTITSYVFDFGDGNNKTVFTGDSSANVSHTYDTNLKSFTATVTVNSKDIQGVTSANCQVTIPAVEQCKPGVPVGSEECQPQECKPGVPVGSPECQPKECKPGVPEGSPMCHPCKYNENLPSNSAECVPPTPPELPNTGPGAIIGFFSATTLAGGLIHRFILRRKATA